MATKEISVLIGEMNNHYNGDPWYGESMRKILEDVDPKNVFDHRISKEHCMAELLSHIITWRKFLVRRLAGDDDFSVDQMQSFDWKLLDKNSHSAWKSMLHLLDADQQLIIQLLEKSDDTLLDKKVAGREYNFRFLIHGVQQHDIYHVGQIALLKKKS